MNIFGRIKKIDKTESKNADSWKTLWQRKQNAIRAAGDIDAKDRKDSILFKDADNYIYKKMVVENNTIVGTILYGDIRDRQKIIKAMETRKDISMIRKDLDRWDLEKLW